MANLRPCLLLILTAAALSGCSSSASFSAAAGIWEPKVDCFLNKEDNTGRLDVRDAGISGETKAMFIVEGSMTKSSGKEGAQRYNVGFWSLSRSGSTDLGAGTLGFDGKTFTGDVHSHLEATDYIFTGEAPGTTQNQQAAGGIFGIHLLNVDYTIEDDLGTDARFYKWVPMPVIGVRYEANVGQSMSAYLLTEFMNLAIFNIKSFDAEFLHVDAGVKIALGNNMSIKGGYKTWSFKVGMNEDYVKLDGDGATVLLEIAF